MPLAGRYGGAQELAEDVGQDAAVAVVLDLDRRVDSTDDVEGEFAAVGPPPVNPERLAWPQARGDACDAERLAPGQLQCLARVALLELQREHAHADQIAAVDPLEALGNHCADAQEHSAFGC